MKKPKRKMKQQRLATKAVKAQELLDPVCGKLSDTQATTFRALAARANDLALGRPDLGYTAKELCREFAQPTSDSADRLQRLVQYLGHPRRLVWNVCFEDETTKYTVYVDTDFAMCHKTRRTASGGGGGDHGRAASPPPLADGTRHNGRIVQ